MVKTSFHIGPYLLTYLHLVSTSRDLDMVGTSQDISRIEVTINDAGGMGKNLTGAISVEDIPIGIQRTHSIKMLWPASATNSN